MSKETTPKRLHNIVDDEMRHVLAKRGNTRSYDDLLVLKSRISQIEYIREMFSNLHPMQIDELCKCMSLEIFEEDEFIFYQGDKGDKFYVVLSGSCDVLLKQRTGIYVNNEDGSRTEQYTYQVIVTSHVGQQFGERALDYDEPRAATIRAGSFCELLTVTQHAYRKILKVPDYDITEGAKNTEDVKGMVNRVLSYTREKRKETDLHAVAEYLSLRIPFFQKFDLDNRIELIRMCELVKIWGKTTLFEQGDPGQAFYIILTGSVDVMISEANDEGVHHTIHVNTLVAGESFGERTLEADSGGKRAATIITSDELTELIIINREEFQSIVSVMFEGDMMSRVRLLRATELFAPLDLKHLHKIARLLTPKTFRLNSVIFKAGDLAKEVYIIYKGECNLDATLCMDNGSSEVVELGRAGPAAVLGDYTFNATSYYDETHYRETAVATALCSTFVFCKIDLFNVLSYEIRNEIITRIKNFSPASSSLWDTTPQLISEADWCIRQTWKRFRSDISQRADKKYSDKTITRHFK
jgi:CRP-like cAMP-binding protein